MQKYYADILTFYAKEDVIYNPTLALYMKEVLLKFHSCLYISSGYSTNQLLNPRYYIKPYNKIGTDFLDFPIKPTQIKFTTNKPDNDIKTNHYLDIIPVHLRDHVFVGLTEELGAKVFKHRGYCDNSAGQSEFN